MKYLNWIAIPIMLFGAAMLLADIRRVRPVDWRDCGRYRTCSDRRSPASAPTSDRVTGSEDSRGSANADVSDGNGTSRLLLMRPCLDAMQVVRRDEELADDGRTASIPRLPADRCYLGIVWSSTTS